MNKKLLMALFILICCSSCSKKRETIKLTQDISDFKIEDENGTQVKPTEEEKYAIKIKVSKQLYYI